MPFSHNVTYNMGNTLYFTTDYSMEQMVNLINNIGHNASLHTNGSVETILISTIQDDFTYYFIIFNGVFVDGAYSYSGEKYTLSDTFSTAVLWIGEDVRSTPYPFLAPLHILEPVYEINPKATRKVFGSFEEIVNFYLATGKDDVIIDHDNKTIYFYNGGSTWFSLNRSTHHSKRQGTVAISFIETELGNYLYIRPQR